MFNSVLCPHIDNTNNNTHNEEKIPFNLHKAKFDTERGKIKKKLICIFRMK